MPSHAAITYELSDGSAGVLIVDFCGPRRWIVEPKFKRLGVQWWKYLSDSLHWDGNILTRIRRGHELDGGSIPKPFQWYEKPDDHLKEYGRHDFHFQFHFVEAWNPTLGKWERVKIGKAHADGELCADLDLAGMRHTKGWAITAGVAIGGWWAWWTGTCNGKHSVCPANAGSWCPMQFSLPPFSSYEDYDDFVSVHGPQEN